MNKGTELSSSMRNADEKFPCDSCTHVANKSGSLQAHKEAKHLGRIHGCDICDFKTPYQNSLERHKLRHSDKNTTATNVHSKQLCLKFWRCIKTLYMLDSKSNVVNVTMKPSIREAFVTTNCLSTTGSYFNVIIARSKEKQRGVWIITDRPFMNQKCIHATYVNLFVKVNQVCCITRAQSMNQQDFLAKCAIENFQVRNRSTFIKEFSTMK